MRISDWSSDVCSSDLVLAFWLFFSHDAYTAFQLVIVTFFMAMFIGVPVAMVRAARKPAEPNQVSFGDWRAGDLQTYTGPVPAGQIGRASCRERGCQYV